MTLTETSAGASLDTKKLMAGLETVKQRDPSFCPDWEHEKNRTEAQRAKKKLEKAVIRRLFAAEEFKDILRIVFRNGDLHWRRGVEPHDKTGGRFLKEPYMDTVDHI